MDKRRKKKIRDILFVASMILLACLFAFIIYMAVSKKAIGAVYYGVVILFLVVFWVLSDVLPIVLTHGFEGKEESQKQAYRIYALIDAVGLAGLGYFALALNSNGMMGAIVYAAAIMMKRKYYDEYLEVPKPEEDSEDGEETSQEEISKIEEDASLPEEENAADVSEESEDK